jgi:integrase
VLFEIAGGPGGIDELAEAWTAELALAGVSAGYVKTVRYRLRKYVYPVLGAHRDVATVRAKDVRSVYTACMGAGLASKTTKHVLGALRALMSYAQSVDVVQHVPKFPTVRVVATKAKGWLNEGAQERVLRRVGELEDCLRLMMETGARPSEAAAVQVRDLVDGGVLIRRAFGDRGQEKSTKTGIEALRPLSEGLYTRLREAAQGERPCAYLWMNERAGRAVNRHDLYRAWRVAARIEGVDVTLYQAFRHSKVSQRRAELVASMHEDLRATLGHTSAGTTIRHYALDGAHERR